ncbi:hypothetical protein VF14_25430 [Nostoc linckia z18]|uniref:Uncharacterized protein n=2 Tax=Nostoc linckia TaxID=92942 RepID=A0A9Q6EJM3_NOSLI|nr:hypothetical protein [Nostoc linckia]PHK27882.1 hypothetical protein VF12_33945 [Nostoc linckia z15]PHK44324.1 hypothetical protein VF13_22610 [Nostoc linckia z16]PHJ56424.1 hypothetical protein VF03_37570 [Nostoc linckia z2]PHJ58656.1 hypothetical protein VF05_33470 [Nostoc linckia z3]PHJ62804.1 hypothetical protein VF02_16790 [Nostoc linckia z1]
MSKPLGHYTSYTPGDGSYLESLQEHYGSMFEKISRREKLFLISGLASHLCVLEPGETRDEIYKLSVQLQIQLEESDQKGLLEALIAQVRWGQNHEEEANDTTSVHNS